jgi:hypothetical protein
MINDSSRDRKAELDWDSLEALFGRRIGGNEEGVEYS